MEIRDSRFINNYNRINLPAKKEAESLSVPTDSFQKQPETKEGGNLLTHMLDIRVPTVTKDIDSERREKIMNSIQPGDIILETNNAYPGWQILEKLTLNSVFSHAAMYEGDGKFIEATSSSPNGGGVVRNDMREFLEGPKMIEILRPNYKNQEERDAAVDYMRSQLGKPYDGDFDLKDDSKMYCAEVVHKALETTPSRISAPLTQVLGKPAVGPDNFKKLPGIQTVYSDNTSFWKNMASHYPIIASAGVTAVAGGLMAGPLGAVGGFAGGLILSTMTGNKMQVGQFALWES